MFCFDVAKVVRNPNKDYKTCFILKQKSFTVTFLFNNERFLSNYTYYQYWLTFTSETVTEPP